MKGLRLGLSLAGSAPGPVEINDDVGFDDDAYWLKSTGAAISGSKAVFNQPYAATIVYVARDKATTPGVAHSYSFTVSNYGGGTIRAYISDTFQANPTFGAAAGANGDFSGQFTPTHGVQFGLLSSNDFIGSIDNFSLMKVA